MQKTLAVVNLTNLKNNAKLVRSLIGERKFFAVVKADGYGHGAEEISRSIESIVDGFCVAIVDEGAKLRVAGISKPILVFTPPLDKSDGERAKYYNLTLTATNARNMENLCGSNFQLKINSGMNRHGCNLSELTTLLKGLDENKLCGVYSHLYCPENDGASEKQLALFLQAVNEVKRVSSGIFAHISASGGILRGGKYLLDGVRCGILLYGYTPFGFALKGLKPVLKVYAQKTQSTEFIGGGVGYNRAQKNYGVVSTYRCGYADGFFRGTPLGEGNLCMDAFVKEGDNDLECVLSNAEEYATRCNTISYEVLTKVTQRAEIVYER